MNNNTKHQNDSNSNAEALFDLAIGRPLTNLLTIADLLTASGHPLLAHQLATHVEDLANLLSKAAETLDPKGAL